MKKTWTDYPFRALGDEPCAEAPIRQCVVLGYDGDKYVTIRIDGLILTVKAGYVYTKPGRYPDVPAIDPTQYLDPDGPETRWVTTLLFVIITISVFITLASIADALNIL